MPKKTFTATTCAAQASATGSGVTLNDFCAYMKEPNKFFFIPCRELWPGSNIDRRFPRVPVLGKNGKPKRGKNGKLITELPTTRITRDNPVEQAVWCPGMPLFIPGRLSVSGSWIERNGVTSFNLYRAPQIKLGDASKAGPWLDHVRKLYGDEADHIIRWLAHRVQRPGEKINHGIVLGGAQGIGKDSLLEPIKRAVGPWNFHEVTPTRIMNSPFTRYAKSVILRINEGRDLGETNRFKFYDHLKTYGAAPPDVLEINEKNLKEYEVANVVGLIITTNYRLDGIYLADDDRRHYVAWSSYKKEDFSSDYWNKLWGWYEAGGFGNVAAYLDGLDISAFDPKKPPPETQTFDDIVEANRPLEEAELADVLDKLGTPDPDKPGEIIWPKAVTAADLIAKATGALPEWLMSQVGRKAVRYRLENLGYVGVKNPDIKDGRWKIGGARQTVYVRTNLSPKERLEAAREVQIKGTEA